jgi:hypothetical protein
VKAPTQRYQLGKDGFAVTTRREVSRREIGASAINASQNRFQLFLILKDKKYMLLD